MKSILVSIKPEGVAKILNGEKTIEICNTAPDCLLPAEVYIYCEKGLGLQKFGNKYFAQEAAFPVRNGKVVAKFTLARVEMFGMANPYEEPTSSFLKKACVTIGQARTYAGGKHPYYKPLYAWHIDGLEIFDEPKELSKFGLDEAPESWCYVEENK